MGEYLKENALDFFKLAEYSLKNEMLNLSLFNMEQAIQLACKYKLFTLTGNFPHTHDIIYLLREIVKLTNNANLDKLLKNEITTLTLIQNAYISARYLPFSVDKDAVIKALEITKGILHELGIL